MIDLQPELEWYMLPFLVDFMIEVHYQFRMSPLTLHLALNIVNRYVSKRIVFKKHYQLVGCTALWIAAKFEDSKDKVPTVRELKSMCVNAYEEDMFIQMEGHVLATLGWDIGGVATCLTFLDHQISLLRGQHGHIDPTLVHLCRFFLDLSLFWRDFLEFKPSEIATASLALSRHILGWERICVEYYTEAEVECIDLFLCKIPMASTILRRKYMNKRFYSVTPVIDHFLAKVARKEVQHQTVASQSQCRPISTTETKAPESHIQLPDTPPHTPVSSSTVPLANNPQFKPRSTGLPTPPADRNAKPTLHVYPNPYSRGTYGRSESFGVDSPVETTHPSEMQEDDMDTECDEDEDMTFYDEEDYDDYDSDTEDSDPMTDLTSHDYYLTSNKKIAPRIVLGPVV
jgi:hypothetical protein